MLWDHAYQHCTFGHLSSVPLDLLDDLTHGFFLGLAHEDGVVPFPLVVVFP